MLRILTVTLNPALDLVYEVPDFTVDKLNRPVAKSAGAGGKGINVARAYRAMGGEATAIVLAGGRIGDNINELMQEEGIPSTFIGVVEESRLCIKITDSVNRTLTELNENGPIVSKSEYAEFERRFRELAPSFDIVVLSGNVPPGISSSVYAELIEIAQEQLGIRVVLDTSGEPLRHGIAARPWMAKPNLEEARGLGIAPTHWQDAARQLRNTYGVTLALVTNGASGGVLSTKDGDWEAKPPSVTVKSAVGSGDSLTAGFLAAEWRGDPAEALKLGVATGAVNATTYRTGEISQDAVADMAKRIIVNRVA